MKYLYITMPNGDFFEKYWKSYELSVDVIYGWLELCCAHIYGVKELKEYSEFIFEELQNKKSFNFEVLDKEA